MIRVALGPRYGSTGVVRKIKNGKIHVAVRRTDGQTERVMLPVNTARRHG